MGFAHHCVYLSFYFYIILQIRQYPKVVGLLPSRQPSLIQFDHNGRVLRRPA